MSAFDPIALEIIRYALCAIPNQVDKNVTRTAFSPLIYEYKDYAVGIVDAEARLICQCKGGLPIFIANALSAAVRDGLRIYGRERLEPGDVVITNHAGTMGQHLNNVVMYTPIHCGPEGRELVGFMAVVMHWMDVGGMIVGSCLSNNTTDIYQEGIQFRTVKLRSRGQPVEEIYRMIEHNTRFPKMVLGDVESQLAACVMGRDMVVELVSRYGLASVRAAIETFWEQAESTMRAAIRAIPDGEYRASAFLDNDGIELDLPIPIDVAVRVDGEEISVDFSDIADQVTGPLNSGYAGGAVAAARIALKYLLSPDEPATEGAFRPLKVVIPEGKLLSARADAPMGGSGSTLPTVIDCILLALGGAAPDRVTAAHHGTYALRVFTGRHPETGALFQHMESGIGGWGAAHDQDGTGPYRSMAHGDTLEVPVELQEALYPYRVDTVALRTDSGGAGRFRGGLGVEKIYTALAPLILTVSFERTKCPPWGLQGGKSGSPGRVEVERAGCETLVIAKGDIQLQAGDRVRALTAGGGGFGPPYDRNRAQVAEDVRFGYVSIEAAGADYGLALDK